MKLLASFVICDIHNIMHILASCVVRRSDGHRLRLKQSIAANILTIEKMAIIAMYYHFLYRPTR